MAEIIEVSTNVKDLIFAYERQTSSTESLEHYEGRRRAKSIGNALSYKLFRQSNLEIHHLVDIEKELVKIEAHLNYYEVYEKATQVAFQEQLLNVLTFIVNIDPEGDENYKQKKKDLIAETQKLFKILTSKLPVYGVHPYRSIQRTASKREEAIVSSTSTRSQERRGISSSQSQLNKAFKSEESLDYSSSVDLNNTEDRPGSVTSPSPPSQISITSETNYIPSVSRLKKFFSFRRDDVKVTPNSGVSRSQSLNVKTNKYTVVKKEEVKKREEVLNENDEEEEFDKHEVLSSTQIITNDENLYVEPVEEIKENGEIQIEQANSVSVSKLKSLFEVKQKETEEGLGSLTNKQPNEFHSDFNLPYTEANLGAFRLKRTISGHYMNFTGLLRNIDIQKKPDLNKSKSLSDLKTSNLQNELKDIDIDDFNKEVDDEADDFEHVSIIVGEELNNNEPHGASLWQQTSQEATATPSNATFVIGNVKTLRKTFENDSNVEDPNADIKHILHRTIEPIPNPDSNLQEPVLKVPIQLRTGFPRISHEEVKVEGDVLTQNNGNLVEETVTSGTVEALKQTFETRSFSNEFKLETSSKLPQTSEKSLSGTGTDFLHVSHSKKATLNGLVTKDEKEDITLHGTINQNKETPNQFTQFNNDSFVEEQINDSIDGPVLRNVEDHVQNNEKLVEEIVTSGTVETLKQTFETRRLSLETSPNLHRFEKRELRVSEMGTDFVHVSRSEKEVDNASQLVTLITSPNGTVTLHNTTNSSVAETIEVPTGFAKINNDGGDATIVRQESVTSGTVEALKQTFEHLSTKTVETSEESALKVPIQLAVDNHNAEENVDEATRNHKEGAVDLSNSQNITNIKKEVEELNITSGTVEALKQSFEHSRSTLDVSSEDIKHVSNRIEPIPNSEEAVKKMQLENFENNPCEYKVTEPSEENSIVEQQINGGVMNILESPTTAYSTLISSSSSHSQQISSSSKVSVSYSQKTSVQRTSSSHVSQKRIVSSTTSTSGLLSQKYFEVLKNSGSPTTEESTVTITEIEDQESPKYNLNISQENLIDEILKETDSYKDVDEEFEKLLENTN